VGPGPPDDPLAPGVDGVLRRLKALGHKEFGGIGGLLADAGHLCTFGGGEILQHVRRRIFTAGGRPMPMRIR